MSRLARTALSARGRWLERTFQRAARDPERAQLGYLARLLRANRETAFGREHGFAELAGLGAKLPGEFARRVPVRDYEEHRPWVDRLLAGERGVLTRQEPLMFATTSGTTDRPKLVPVTRSWLRELSRLMGLWLHGARRDHPGLLGGRYATFVSPAVEGHTEGGAPTGSVSGLTARRAPSLVRRSYAVPYEVAEIADYDHRYLVAARMMLAVDVSLLAAPNPSTLLRLLNEGEAHGEAIVRAVRDGTLGVSPGDSSKPGRGEDELYARLERALRPEPDRARVLEACLERHGRLAPREVWPRLALIGCWLGGSAGVQAERLAELFGDVPRRDLGLRATEATVTVPFENGTPAGPLAVHAGYFEFVPEEAAAEIDTERPPAFLAHELEDGRRYSVLLTTSGGLYRYDLNDVVEVRGFHGRTPKLAFLRKGRDVVSLTGEKLHSAQIAAAAERAARSLALDGVQVQLVPDVSAMRYDLLVECRGGAADHAQRFAESFDANLRELNVEYATKRDSRRLRFPRPIAMQPGWADRKRRRDVELGGKRDAQYKWPLFRMEWDAETRAEIDGEVETDPGAE